MDYDPAWIHVMGFIAAGRAYKWPDAQIITLLAPAPEDIPTVEALLADHRQNPSAFMAALAAMDRAAEAAKRAKRKTQQQQREAQLAALTSAYLALGRRAYALAEAKRARSAPGARLQYGAAWMARPEGGMPPCAQGHLMDLAVYVTAAEVAEFTPELKHGGDVVLCACMRDDCLAEEGAWRLVAAPANVARLAASGGWVPRALQAIIDHPGPFEPGLAARLRPTMPQASEREFDEALAEVIGRSIVHGRSRIGGYGSFANPPACEACGAVTCAPLVTIDPGAMGIRAAEDGHVILVVCRSCGRSALQVEST
jgi:hypothetical protein